MKINRYQWLFVVIVTALWTTACGSGSDGNNPVAVKTKTSVADKISGPVIEPLDTEQDITKLSMQELRILRSSVYARHGMLFGESDLRDYWRSHTAWYDTLSRSVWKNIYGGQPVDIMELPANEQDFVSQIDNQMGTLRQVNYIASGDDTLANILNIVNMFQYPEITKQNIVDELAFNNFAIVTDTLPQLFQVYQRNDSLRLPNFVTTDLMLQLSHVYYLYMLRTVEEKHLAPTLASLCLSLYRASMEQAKKETKEENQDLAYYNAAFYAIPYTLLTGKSLKVAESYQVQMEEELAYIAQQEDHSPALLSFDTNFPYSAFQPHGHYTRTALLRRYFKALRWVQLAPYCHTNKTQLQQAVLVAALLNSEEGNQGEPLINTYRSYFETVSYLTGQPAWCSILDIATFLQKERISNVAAAMNAKTLAKAGDMLKKTEQSYPRMAKFPTGCNSGIYFMPQPYCADNEVLQAMTDKTRNAKRAFPGALDVFAAFGSQPAFDKLLVDHQTDTLWQAYPGTLSKIKDKMQDFTWNNSLYNKWLECLMALQKTPPHAPPLMRTQAWKDKNLSTVSASWMKLKHDAILYGEIPDHPEPLDSIAMVPDSLPDAVVMGYVEPNAMFWEKLLGWVELTGKTLNRNNLMTDTLRTHTARLYKYISIMKAASEKELKHERLSNETYQFIAHVGDSIEQFTLSMIEPQIDRWGWAAGTDKSVAVFEDVYQRNVTGCEKNGTMYSATGKANNIYVVVETDGYLFLVKGAIFNYYEFFMPKEQILSAKSWQDMLKSMEQ